MNAIAGGIEMALPGATALNVDTEIADRPTVKEAGIDALVREFLHQTPNKGGFDAANSTKPLNIQSAPRRDFDMATELLDRAGQAFDVLINRCQALEHDIEDANERAQARAVEQDEEVEKWKQVAAALKIQLENTEKTLHSLRNRCNAVEARAVKAEEQVKALETASVQAAEQAAQAESLSTKLHDKVVAAFGIGSRAHPVLEAVATRAAAQ